MFTGIIEEIGMIKKIQQYREAIVIKIAANKILSDVNTGDSIAVNGVCLTVTSFTNEDFTVDVMPETVKSTSLRFLKQGSTVNLERAMRFNGRFGGHFVSGHVDGIGKIRSKRRVDNAVYYEIDVLQELLQYIVYKGSIAVDGTSLTVFNVTNEHFTISLIPHTLHETILGEKEPGDIVNIECDMLGKYVEKFVKSRFESEKPRLTEAFLKDNGFA